MSIRARRATLSLLVFLGTTGLTTFGPSVLDVLRPTPAEAQSPTGGATSAPLVLRGHVDGVQGWLIHTTVPTSGPGGVSLEDGDGLQLQIGNRQFFARFVSPERYARLAADTRAAETLDVDIVCTSDASGVLVVAPLAGSLQDVLHLTAATPVTVVRP
jgi:hypothetical protein